MSLGRQKAAETEEQLLKYQEEFLGQKTKEEWAKKMPHHENPVRIGHKNLCESSDSPFQHASEQVGQSILSDIFERDVVGGGGRSGPSSSPRRRLSSLSSLSPRSSAGGRPEQREDEPTRSEPPLRIRHKNLSESDDSPFAHFGQGQQPQRHHFRSSMPAYEQRGESVYAREMRRQQEPQADVAAKISREENTQSRSVLDWRTKQEIDLENRRRLAETPEAEILAEQKKLQEQLDPKLIEFIRSRGQDLAGNRSVTERRPTTEDQSGRIDNAIRNLELMSVVDAEDFANHNSGGVRLALDPLQYDLAEKCAQLGRTSRERLILGLFDVLRDKTPSTDEFHSHYHIESMRKSLLSLTMDSAIPSAELNEIARQNMQHIKNVYQKEVGPGQWAFCGGIEPLADGLWMFKPIHDFFFAVGSGRQMDQHAIDTVAYCLLWCHLLFDARPSYFNACMTPAEVYCRLAQTFLLGGPEILGDVVIYSCLLAFLKNYFAPAVEKKQLHLLPVNSEVAGFTSFLPLYKDLMQEFGSSSFCDAMFANYILLPAYGNAAAPSARDRILLELWSDERPSLLKVVHLTEKTFVLPKSYYEGKSCCAEVLLAYGRALTSRTLNKERNELLHTIATNAIKIYLRSLTNQEIRQSKLAQCLDKCLRNAML